MQKERRLAILLRVGIALTLVLFVTAAAAEEQASHPATPHHPPQQGKFVRGHWTPYEPPDPAAFPEDSRLHTIVQGDTLWDLSTTYLGDPWLWPQIWDQNRYILDSHWIYPGDPLLIPAPPTVVAGAETGGEAEPVEPAAEPAAVEPAPVVEAEPEPVEVSPILSPGARIEPQPTPIAPLVAGAELRPVADETDLYCGSYAVPLFQLPTLQIAEREEGAKQLLTNGDVVYLNGGRSEDVLPGQEYLIVRGGDKVNHPLTGEKAGDLVHQIGRLTVLVAQEHTATATLHASCREVELGDQLLPFQEVPVPLSADVPLERYDVDLSDGQQGFVIHGRGTSAGFAAGDVVVIDVSDGQPVRPGDFLMVFRDYRFEHGFYTIDTYIDPPHGDKLAGANNPYPPAVIGQIVVLRVNENLATAKIVHSFREIVIGDKLHRL